MSGKLVNRLTEIRENYNNIIFGYDYRSDKVVEEVRNQNYALSNDAYSLDDDSQVRLLAKILNTIIEEEDKKEFRLHG